MFDAKQYLAALEPPTFIAPDGSRFDGRLLSIEEWQPYEERMRLVALGKSDYFATAALLRDLTMRFFPRGWQFWTARFWRPCWYHVRRLPPVGQLRAVFSFMQSQRKALGMEMPEFGTKMRELLGID